MVYTVCASAVISPLKQWLDSYTKTRLKMCHPFKHFIHMQYFCCWLVLLSSLCIELALVCCTNPDNVHCFWTIFPNLKFVFASICATSPVHIQSDQYKSCWTVKQRRAVAAPFIPMGSNQKQRCGSEFAKWHDIYTPEECADEWRPNNADLKLPENCHEWFHDGHWTGEFATVIWRLHSFTVSFRGDVLGEYGPKELRNK